MSESEHHADEVGRPGFESVAQMQDWHLTKIGTSSQAHIDPTGDVLNARQLGVSWEAIAAQCGITPQEASERWGNYAAPGAGMDA